MSKNNTIPVLNINQFLFHQEIKCFLSFKITTLFLFSNCNTILLFGFRHQYNQLAKVPNYYSCTVFMFSISGKHTIRQKLLCQKSKNNAQMVLILHGTENRIIKLNEFQNMLQVKCAIGEICYICYLILIKKFYTNFGILTFKSDI